MWLLCDYTTVTVLYTMLYGAVQYSTAWLSNMHLCMHIDMISIAVFEILHETNTLADNK